MPDLEIDDVAPWEFRLAYLLPIPAFGTAVVFTVVLLGAFLGFCWAFGFSLSGPGEVLTEPARDSIFACMLVGYVFAGLRLGAAGIERDLGRAGVAGRAELGRLPLEIVRRSRYAGGVSLALSFFMVEAAARSRGYAMAAPWTEIHESSFFLWLIVLLFWVIGRAAAFTISGSRYAADATTEEIEIDLLALEPLNAFGRIGLRFALLWIVGVTIAAPILLGPRLEIAGLLLAAGVVGVIATAALMIPVVGVRNEIRATKQAELDRLAAAIAGDETAISQTRIAGRRGEPSLADLIAYRGLVESAREWPYDSSTLSRFALYLLIPLASWVAAAFVERGVDGMLR